MYLLHVLVIYLFLLVLLQDSMVTVLIFLFNEKDKFSFIKKKRYNKPIDLIKLLQLFGPMWDPTFDSFTNKNNKLGWTSYNFKLGG